MKIHYFFHTHLNVNNNTNLNKGFLKRYNRTKNSKLLIIVTPLSEDFSFSNDRRHVIQELDIYMSNKK